MHFLEKLTDELKVLEQLDVAIIEQKLHLWEGALASIEPHITQPDTLPYGRKTVYADDKLEIVVVHLPPGVETAIHDHGESEGCALVVSGMVINKTYRKNSCGDIELIKEAFVPKEHCFRFPKHVIHAVQNPSHVSAVTLHIYTPPITRIRTYEELPHFIASYI